MSDLFYRAFEEKHRGSRELIKSRLQVYLPFVRPLLKANPSGKALDLGCGRGEWLELLGEQGFEAIGVDLDDGMLQACRERELNVETADAVAYMQGLPKDCLCIVSGFHIAEHLPFEELKTLALEALRVLMPGGVLIIETPNPENITVGSNTFYMDPTHQRPIPPELLSFLPEYFGYERWKILRLQESPHLRNAQGATLIEVLKGVSPDYAMVAQKAGPKELIESMNEAFETEYGLTLDNIAEKFQIELNLKSDMGNQLQQALELVQTTQAQMNQAEAKTQQAETICNLHDSQIDSVYNSTSWRITAPLRWPMHLLRLLRAHGLKKIAKKAVKKVLRRAIPFVVARPKLKAVATRFAYKMGIADRLKPFMRILFASYQQPFHQYTSQQVPADLQSLTPQARHILLDLKLAVKKKQKGGA